MNILIDALHLLLRIDVILAVVLSSIYGLLVGSIPGLTATMAMALLVPITFFLDPVPALATIVSMSAMAIFAGDIPATLLRIPGTPASSAYVDEAFALTRKGRAGSTLGTLLTVGVLGGLFGAIVLMLLAPILAEFAMQFTSFEYFWLACLGLSCSVIVSNGSLTKGLISMLLGVFVTTIGIDISLGFSRFTFNNSNLLGGISYIPVMIGMFGVAEVFRNLVKPGLGKKEKILDSDSTDKILQGQPRIIGKYKLNILRSSVIGTLIGILPGAGGDIASWISYAVSKRSSKARKKYGTGYVEGLVDAGAANNAALGGTWIPALVFGIPGDSITAIVIGVLYMKGLRPGPGIFTNTPDILYAVYLIFILANILLLPFGFLAIKASRNVIKVPKKVLVPAILLFCVIGAFAINNSYFDIIIMLIAGVAGFLMEMNGFPVAPCILGLVLGQLLEQNFMISMMKSSWELSAFFSRPISGTLGVIVILIWIVPLGRYIISSLRAGKKRMYT